MKKAILLLILFLLIFSRKTYSTSDYVLPYPSAMPGSIWYKMHLVLEGLESHWYFGNFAQFTYSLKQSDRYLVEAKTLFEYKQYLLGYKSLKKSDHYFSQAPRYLKKAEKEQKNITDKKGTLQQASKKHRGVLTIIVKDLPENVMWRPEKESATKLPLRKSIQESIHIRSNI